MGGDADSASACAVEITRGWERHENFELYDDVPDALAALRSAGLRIGVVSNSASDVREFARPPRGGPRRGVLPTPPRRGREVPPPPRPRRRRRHQLLPPRPLEAACVDL